MCRLSWFSGFARCSCPARDLLHGPFERILGSAAPSSPATRAKTGRTAQVLFCNTRGAHTHTHRNRQAWQAYKQGLRMPSYPTCFHADFGKIMMSCAKGSFAKGFWGCTRFSLLRREKGSETPS